MDTSQNIEQRFKELEERVARLEGKPSNSNQNVRDNSRIKKVSPQEFLATKDAKTDVRKVLVLGYYLEHTEGMSSFNVADIENVFRSAKEKPPKNINDVVNKNINPGRYLMDAAEKKDDKKAWVLTTTGEKYVENELSNKAI